MDKKFRSIDAPWERSVDAQDPRTSCIKWMKDFMSKKEAVLNEGDDPRPLLDVMRELMDGDPENWWVGHHFMWGMWMRNQMRTHGFGEKEMGVNNLDDIYIEIIEAAARL